MSAIRVEERTSSEAVVALLSGEITSETAPSVHEKLLGLVAPRGRLVVDLSGVTYVSSAGLRVLVLLHRRAAQAGARIELTGLPEAIRFTMAATGFLELFVVSAGDGAVAGPAAAAQAPVPGPREVPR